MKLNFISYLKRNKITDISLVNKLIISAFYEINNIHVKNNKLVIDNLISHEMVHEYGLLKELCSVIKNEVTQFTFEHLISFFEFVISPSDRVVNGAIYTPYHIREFIINESIDSESNLDSMKIADIACGCGSFLYDVAKKIHKSSNKNYYNIFKDNIYGNDIEEYSINRTKLILSTLAIISGEDLPEFKFNLFVGDSLDFEWTSVINERFDGFDLIIGNPPYVCARNLSDTTKHKLKRWSVCDIGNPDLYIPFFQIGLEALRPGGSLAYITMNSFFKSLNGRSLRRYLQEKSHEIKIIDFGSEQIFNSKNTYTCICFVKFKKSSHIFYKKHSSLQLRNKTISFDKIPYKNLDFFKGWNLKNHQQMEKIESIGTPFGKHFATRHGIATLKNDVFIFSPDKEDDIYYYFEKEKAYKVEKAICRNIINSNKLSSSYSLDELLEIIIFPYSKDIKPIILEETHLKESYPFAYKYLLDQKENLLLRDKGKKQYPQWYAYGRTQSLEKTQYKLFIPKISNAPPKSILSSDPDLMFYNGIAILGHSYEQLVFAKKIIESKIFWHYIKTTSKPYNSNYYSLNGNYINNFGIYDFTDDEIKYIISEENQDVIDDFFEAKYRITFK
ncbi:N-6 DNA methylase [Enterobacter cloacae subsp. cloacae]|uniref:Eco57I restriction-modification methylase domain-containing protein n=1 Tax=Enterobacter cloacae TaxID=550 RepID=UPI0009F56B3B|nr:N-6 DNA methylase [Enterobacter cloacae]ORC18373.1 N-6 DNA methylase [Enterobacter cloacae subsp. cloacae]